jgi:pyruvate/2-oxoglutarate/acetoin dehydrogenase E1 component
VGGGAGHSTDMSFAQAVRAAMAQELARDDAVFTYGEGINDPHGFFGTTAGLADQFGPSRCFDVPNCEETLTGFGVGAALMGLRPIFVNLRVEFLLLAMNQIVNHAAKWSTMFGRQVSIPLTMRAMVGRGWGQGAQHSGSYASLLAHVPGLQVAVASSPSVGASLLVSAVRGDTPTILIEPKAVFEQVEPCAVPFSPMAVGRAGVRRAGNDFTLVAVGDAVRLALEAAEALSRDDGIEVEVVDACWFAPFDGATIAASVARTGRIGVVDIGWDRFGLASEVARRLLEIESLRLRSPLLSWSPAGHAPAGCFAEAVHYPTASELGREIRAACDGTAPPSRPSLLTSERSER